MTPDGDLVVNDGSGLFCQAGGFHVDPWSPVPCAVITHAHSDHARGGSERYIATPETADVMRSRISAELNIETVAYGQTVRMGTVQIRLEPAGHVLGSAQIVVTPDDGPTWCITGDYKVEPDRTCVPFQPQACDVLVTESTFGLPVFRWRSDDEVVRSMNAWRAENAAAGRTSVLLCYAFGKAQRVVASLDPSVGPIGLHGSVRNMCEVYARHGISFPKAVHANAENADVLRAGGTIVAPPSALTGPWLRRFVSPTGGMRTAMVSGWMALRGRRRWRGTDTGFVLSDHADWPGLIDTIRATGAKRVLATHGYASQLARFVREELRIDAGVLPTRYGDAEEAEADVVADVERA